MRNKKDLFVTSDIVKKLLIKDERCRNDDGYLYYKVITEIAKEKGVDISWVSLRDYLLNMHGRQFPCFETVRRSRTKVQELNPELDACDTVKGYREEHEAEFREWNRAYI